MGYQNDGAKRPIRQILRELLKSFAVICGAVLLAVFLIPVTNSSFSGNEVLAAQSSTPQGAGQSMKGGSGEQGQGGKMTSPKGGAKGVKDTIFLNVDDDSDRPAWAQGNREDNPHNQGGGQPEGSGVKKGDLYGDLWVIVRDPETGLAILDENGFVQPIILLADGTTQVIHLTDDGEVPPEYEPYLQEVETGRLSVGRAPDKVTEQALDEVLSKLDNGTVFTLDDAGRLVIDGATVDSPLENLALYIALMTEDPVLIQYLDKLPADPLIMAPSLLAAAADKTGEVTIDLVAYQNAILGICAMTPDDYFDYSSYDYDRDTTYSGDISYYVQHEDGTVELVTESMMVAIFDGVSYTSSDGAGITDFTQAADDALQVIEFVHTQIHTE